MFILNGENLLVDLLDGDVTAEDDGRRQVTSAEGVARRHDIPRVEDLLRQLRHRQRRELLVTAARQRCECRQEEVQSRERHHINGQFA